MSNIKMDEDAAQNLSRQAEMLESRLDHLVATWDETMRCLSHPQSRDLIESLRDAALEHRLFLQETLRRCRTKNY